MLCVNIAQAHHRLIHVSRIFLTSKSFQLSNFFWYSKNSNNLNFITFSLIYSQHASIKIFTSFLFLYSFQQPCVYFVHSERKIFGKSLVCVRMGKSMFQKLQKYFRVFYTKYIIFNRLFHK